MFLHLHPGRVSAPVSRATKGGDVDPDVLSQIALRYSLEVIGPVPDGYL